MNEILNYIKINEMVSTSGQPSAQEFEKIKEEGFEIVINLALHNASNAIENEDKVVTDLGMSYFHIPVDFEDPKTHELRIFINTLQALGANKVWVHCAMNYRVSAFMYVYHKYVLRTPFEEINLSMFDEWSPDKKWQTLMKTSLEELQKA